VIKVLQIVASLEVGGLESLVVDMARVARARDFASIICALDGGETLLSRRATAHGVPVVFVNRGGGRRRPAVLASVASLVLREGVDVLHSHNATAHVLGAAAAALTRRPLVHTKHGNILPFQSFKAALIHRAAALATARIVAVSRLVERTVIEGYRVRSGKVTTILNGIDVGCYSRRAVRPGAEVIGAVGRLSREKDYPTMLNAFNAVLEKHASATLRIAGDGPVRAALEAEASRLGVAGRARFLGLHGDIPRLLGELDLFVQSSVTEGISLTLLEAMSAGLPVVATDVGGNREVVVDGVTGFLVPARDASALAERICTLLGDPPLARRLGEAGQARVREMFSIERMVKEYHGVYRGVV
jgi:glycosyltransferase involved in cell wall biosynthesis